MQALQAGRLTATGLANGEGDRREIPSLQWVDREFSEDLISAKPKDFSRTTATVWHKLRVPREAVLALWPDPLESLAMADDHNRTLSDTRTGAAIAACQTRKANRLRALKRFIDDVYEAANQGDLNLGSGNDRKALPFSTRALRGVCF